MAAKKRGLVPCAGGEFDAGGNEAIRALSMDQVKAIAPRFNTLSPYGSSYVKSLLKIEEINFAESDSSMSSPLLWGYAIATKRYALYRRTGDDIEILKASGHGLGYLFAPKENQSGDDETENDDKAPEWVVEAWEWLLRRELGLPANKPSWLRLPAMMRVAMTSPNVMKTGRPEWLAPFNFFLFPLLSDLGGYPQGYERSNFRFITPPESNRRKWKRLEGINLWDEKRFRISMYPDGRKRFVVPESFQIILRQYLGHPEHKSLAPDGGACTGNTQGVLRRASIVAGEIVPIGKETDRRWEHGEDPSMADFKVTEFRKHSKMRIAGAELIRKAKEISVRHLMRKSGLSQKAVYSILSGQPVHGAR